MGDDFEGLIQAARDAMSQAYCPYSNFNVGAALLTADDKVITGVNVENASYSAAICAERCALARAVAQGHRKFEAIAVCAAPAEPTPPCGICRQFLIEFGDMKVKIILKYYLKCVKISKKIFLDAILLAYEFAKIL
ncbi:unnamed protein product [Thelazia callipaeda]|uniref:Cytidine deaminase n=1 Tax=Thelazia callipaeda TaxID=103827 RepID=A0A0N5CMY8_THECL|nr:unnamed protein product [Thelazia callipaeda]